MYINISTSDEWRIEKTHKWYFSFLSQFNDNTTVVRISLVFLLRGEEEVDLFVYIYYVNFHFLLFVYTHLPVPTFRTKTRWIKESRNYNGWTCFCFRITNLILVQHIDNVHCRDWICWLQHRNGFENIKSCLSFWGFQIFSLHFNVMS